MDAYQILDVVLSVIDFLLIIPGLWIAGKFLPKLLAWIHPEGVRDQLSHPLPRTVLWLALGTLFTYPLLDLLGLVSSWPAFVAPSSGSFATAFGTVSGNSVAQFSIILMVLVYLAVWWGARRFMTPPEQLEDVEWVFLVLVAASLIYHLLSREVMDLLQLPLPNAVTFTGPLGTGGFVLAVVVGLALIAVIVLGMNQALSPHPMDDER